jgi:hypothetical protein
MMPISPTEGFASADCVFVGVVRGRESLRQPMPGDLFQERLFRFEVLGAWKGLERPDAFVRTGSGGGDCGYAFAVGGVYLVYANRQRGSDTLSTGFCTRTRPIERAAEDYAALGAPAYSTAPFADWVRRGPPQNCPLHPENPLRPVYGWALQGLSPDAARQFSGVRESEFPYAGLDADTTSRAPGTMAGADGNNFTCGVCREAAFDWAHHNGMRCRMPQAAAGMERTTPSAEFSDAQYRRAYPDTYFALRFDDGRRLKLDTMEGRLERRYGTVPDTSIALVFADSTMRRLYDLIIAHRAFDRDEPHPPYPSADRAGEPLCASVELAVRSHTLVREYRWEPALAPRAPAPDDPWGSLGAVARAIVSAIEAHPSYRALPVRDAR